MRMAAAPLVAATLTAATLTAATVARSAQARSAQARSAQAQAQLRLRLSSGSSSVYGSGSAPELRLSLRHAQLRHQAQLRLRAQIRLGARPAPAPHTRRTHRSMHRSRRSRRNWWRRWPRTRERGTPAPPAVPCRPPCRHHTAGRRAHALATESRSRAAFRACARRAHERCQRAYCRASAARVDSKRAAHLLLEEQFYNMLRSTLQRSAPGGENSAKREISGATLTRRDPAPRSVSICMCDSSAGREPCRFTLTCRRHRGSRVRPSQRLTIRPSLHDR